MRTAVVLVVTHFLNSAYAGRVPHMIALFLMIAVILAVMEDITSISAKASITLRRGR